MTKVFIFVGHYVSTDGVPFLSNLYLEGLDSSKPDDVLEQYLIWYNQDFRLNGCDTVLPVITKEQFKFVESVCPIDFSEELRNAKSRQNNIISGNERDI